MVALTAGSYAVGTSNSVESANAGSVLTRHRPADRPLAHDLGVVVDDNQSHRERHLGVLHDAEGSRRLEGQRFEDQARCLEREGERFERELRLPSSVEQPESDAWKKIDKVKDERPPTGLELSRPQMLGRVTDKSRLVHLRCGRVLLQALMRGR